MLIHLHKRPIKQSLLQQPYKKADWLHDLQRVNQSDLKHLPHMLTWEKIINHKQVKGTLFVSGVNFPPARGWQVQGEEAEHI